MFKRNRAHENNLIENQYFSNYFSTMCCKVLNKALIFVSQTNGYNTTLK
jgi:hypothetical protein